MKRSISNEQLFQCLNCSIGYTVIYGIKDIYEIVEAEKRKDKEYKTLIEESKDSIEEMSKYLELEGDFDSKLKNLKKLCSQEKLSNIEDNFCLFNLQRIIYPLRQLYLKNCSDEDIVERNSGKQSILRCMSKVNKLYIPKYDSEIDKKVLSYFSKSNFTDEYMEFVAKGIRKIWESYRFKAKPQIDNKSQCFQQLLLLLKAKDQVVRNNSIVGKGYFEHVGKLKPDYQIIIQNYLAHAPKNLGSNLSRIMQRQNMSEQDIFKLTGLRVSNIQSLMKSQTTKLSEPKIDLLCRALLVSKSLLITGTGERYGNWQDLFDLKELLDLKETELMQDEKCIKKSYKTKTQFDNELKTIIYEIIRLSDDEFREYVSVVKIFKKETINLYENVIEQYNNLLHQEEANTLLEVLEKLNNS